MAERGSSRIYEHQSQWHAPLTEFCLQPLRKLGEIDDHPLVCADADDLASILCPDCERDASSVDLGDFGLSRDAPAGRGRGPVATLDPRAERASAASGVARPVD